MGGYLMKSKENKIIVAVGQALAAKIDKEKANEWLSKNAKPYRELMTYYKCALMEIETKFNVLSEEFSLLEDSNPIESIKTRLKTPESIFNKMMLKGYPLTVESIEKNLNDIAGIRVICSFQSDIYKLAEALTRQDDVNVIQIKDYIENPKSNGYRSLHMIIEIPIFLHDEKKNMKVEVQFRTLAMDMWASLEHKMKYKKNITLTDEQSTSLRGCSELSDMLDKRMEELYMSIIKNKTI